MPSGFLNEDDGVICIDCGQRVPRVEYHYHRCVVDSLPPATQRTMFSGLDCLPGQQDLFPTDVE